MMQRVELPAQAMMEQAERAGATDPLQVLRARRAKCCCARRATPMVRRVFEISYHKCEYVGDAAAIRERQAENQKECLRTIEHGIRACMREGLLPKRLDARIAALGAMAYVSGILYHWVLAPESFALERHAESLVDTYFRGLATLPAKEKKASARSAP
jgi:TetR/AcrR family acrAB operon transcriptional repressor